jgi:LysR family transcriptional regulator, low CO2-responsive transcriptional regulator
MFCFSSRIPGFYFLASPLVVVAPTHHPLATQAKIPIAQLAGKSFVMREVGSATRQAVQTLLDQNAVKVRVQFEVGNNEAIKQMIMHGLGISVLSYHMVADEVANGQLAILDVEGFPIKRSWYVVYPLSKPLPIVASTFLQFLEQEVIELTAIAA